MDHVRKHIDKNDRGLKELAEADKKSEVVEVRTRVSKRQIVVIGF